jgi:hypothetical protein
MHLVFFPITNLNLFILSIIEIIFNHVKSFLLEIKIKLDIYLSSK